MTDPTLRDFLEQRLDAMDKALILQGLEYERRLELANNAIARADAERARVVSRDVFDQRAKDTDHRLEDLNTWRNRVEGGLILIRVGGVAGIVALLMALARLAGVTK